METYCFRLGQIAGQSIPDRDILLLKKICQVWIPPRPAYSGCVTSHLLTVVLLNPAAALHKNSSGGTTVILWFESENVTVILFLMWASHNALFSRTHITLHCNSNQPEPTC